MNDSLEKFAEMVYSFCGLNYLNSLPTLQMKMQRRLNELNMTFAQYIDAIFKNEQEWEVIVELLTVNETYFYREDKQLTYFKDILLPKLQLTTSKATIWSAACSTGEEPYSLAIMSHLAAKKPEVEIEATDINKRVLKHAQAATYNKKSLSFRRIPEQWLEKYFIEDDHALRVKDCIRNTVLFKELNLIQTNQYAKAKYDVIFCRNVLIYFDDETTLKIINGFYDALKENGYLFLGHAETLSKYDTKFRTVHDNGMFFYQKEGIC